MGPHAGVNKFGAIYSSIACLPPNIASRLSSILFTGLIHSEDKKKTTNRKVFSKLIEELNRLQKDGIIINVNGILKRVKFQLTLILGDNLGLNGIFGFVESLKAFFFCRICKAHSLITAKMVKEDMSLLRTKINYEEDVQKTDVSSTGVKELCAFHEVKDFHLTENVSVDMMHDLLEGVCMYDLRCIINTLIYTKEYFTLEFLNQRIQQFQYGPTEQSNRPPVISINRIKGKLNFIMSAAETLCLVRYFGLIIGDQVPEEEECWKLYKYLRQIIDILSSPRIIRSDAKRLELLIKNHNQLFIQLYGNLKPKFHNLAHYPRLLLQNGPCINYWCMRFEACHRSIKKNAQSSSCTKNLLITIATKQMLKMCEMMYNLETQPDVNFGSPDLADSEAKRYMSTTEKATEVEYYNNVEIFGTLYKIGMFVSTNISQSEKEFGEILKIIKVNNEVIFHLNIFNEITFDDHVHAYIVNSKPVSKQFISYNNLPLIAPCLSVVINGTHYVATRYGL